MDIEGIQQVVFTVNDMAAELEERAKRLRMQAVQLEKPDLDLEQFMLITSEIPMEVTNMISNLRLDILAKRSMRVAVKVAKSGE
ncbi:hypothetical protein [Aeromonas veronii]|nr:hypothetical protein [Aeromonas veronii]